jgi:glycosyltransferase involved in cell wall biosynthesis
VANPLSERDVTPGYQPDHHPVPVVLDGQSLTSIASGGGIATYIRNLMGALAVRDDVALTALCEAQVPLPNGVSRIRMRRVSRRPRVEVVEHSVRAPVELWRSRGAGSVFHNPSYRAPFGVRAPWVQTLHDVIPLIEDHPDSALLRRHWKHFGPRYLNAAAVIAISRYSADEGIRVLGLDPAKVHVALHGVEPMFCVEEGETGAGPCGDGGAGAGGGSAPYLLIVSEFSARKGFPEAFAVMDALVEAGYPHRLVVAGRIHYWEQEAMAKLHASTRHPERIELLGRVDDLVSVYRGASAFLWTSRYEGFGLPPLEAMASGVPVVSFSNSAVTEVVGDGGLLVPDGDVVAMTAAVRQVLDSPSMWSELRERGLNHSRPFTWARSAAIHAEVYRSVAESAG